MFYTDNEEYMWMLKKMIYCEWGGAAQSKPLLPLNVQGCDTSGDDSSASAGGPVLPEWENK